MNIPRSHMLKMASKFDTSALAVLVHLEDISSHTQLHTVFDEYIFFGDNEEIARTGDEGSELTEYAMLTPADQKQNAKTRSARGLSLLRLQCFNSLHCSQTGCNASAAVLVLRHDAEA